MPARVWSKGSDVDKPDNLWIGTGFNNHCATVGVAHQNHRATSSLITSLVAATSPASESVGFYYRDIVKWLHQKLDGSGFHRLHGHWNVTMTCDEDDWHIIDSTASLVVYFTNHAEK